MVGDWELLQAWREESQVAGNELVGRHFAAISRFFRSKLAAEADDLIQQTFLACVESRDRIEGGSFRSYLFGIARRKLFDFLRKRYRQPGLDFGVSSLADLGTTPSEGIARDQQAQMVHAAMRQISAEAQIALELAYWEGLSGAEMAVVMDVEPGTVRSRLTRARVQLREMVTKLGGDAASLFDGEAETSAS